MCRPKRVKKIEPPAASKLAWLASANGKVRKASVCGLTARKTTLLPGPVTAELE